MGLKISHIIDVLRQQQYQYGDFEVNEIELMDNQILEINDEREYFGDVAFIANFYAIIPAKTQSEEISRIKKLVDLDKNGID